MKTFIDHIVDHLGNTDPHKLGSYAFVFPTRRACYYFRDALLKRYADETFWIPRIFSIDDFIMHCSDKTVGSEIDLLFALYECYRQTYLPLPSGETDKEELPTFDRFYAWGQMLLKDFDEADRYLVDTDKLYQNLEHLTALEAKFQGSEEMKDALKRFNDMMGHEDTTLKANFNNQWSRVSKTYHLFRQYLEDKNLYYGGLLYRELAEKLRNSALELPFDQVVYAGFNALSKAEEVIIDSLLKSDTATLIWDADRQYLDGEIEEAGKFMRRNLRKWPPSSRVHWIITDMVSDPKDVKVLGGVQAVGQAQVLGQLLEELPADKRDKCGIVLADEGVLFQVLYALPENFSMPNVTMGYPAKHSHWFHLAKAYMEYQLHLRGKDEDAYADTGYTRALLDNPLVKRLTTAPPEVATSKSKWIPVQILLDTVPSTMVEMLTPRARVVELIDSLVQILMSIYQRFRLEEQLEDFESELAFHSLKHLMQLQEQIRKHSRQLEPRTLARLVVQAFEQTRVPFSGEPTTGLQLMGFLETRVIDFEYLIILSANEGKLPRGNRQESYIPFAMRKAFKLPTFEEQDAIYAYHFKRILQRAKEITIIYNTEVAVDGSGEKSRYIWQLKEVLPENTIKEATYQMGLTKLPVSGKLTIEKSAEVMRMMNRFQVDREQVKSLSPTAIRHYLDCSLRFYFRYIIRLREREQESLEIDARDFGNIVHQTFETLYSPYIGETLTKEQIRELLNSNAIKDGVDQSISDYFKVSAPRLSGKDILQHQIIQKVVYKAMENDLVTAPFLVVGTEMKLKSDLEVNGYGSVRLEGTLDKVYHKREHVHIVDYKTGRVDLKYTRGPVFPTAGAEYIQEHFENPKLKSGFQGFFYGYLWYKTQAEVPLNIGVYPLKKVNEGIRWLNHGQAIPPAGFEEFETQLSSSLQELFNAEVPFTQTTDADRCRFCTYKEICQR